jgi:hypothetical protein
MRARCTLALAGGPAFHLPADFFSRYAIVAIRIGQNLLNWYAEHRYVAEGAMKAMFLGVLAAIGLSGVASAAGPSGAWVVKADFGPQFKYTLLCVLSASGEALAGPCNAVTGRTLQTVGRLTADTLRFAYDTDFNGGAIRLDYSGRMQADGVVRGAVETRASAGVFEARRVLDSAADQTSAWKVDVGFTQQLKYRVMCGFKAEGARLRGPCAITVGETLLAKGSADGAAVTFAYDTQFQGRPVHVVYSGTVQPDGSLKGAIRSGDATGAFTATRQ